MSDWQSIETAPENTPILVWCSWRDEFPIFVDRFRWVLRTTEEVQSDSTNEKGRRRIIQEFTNREREWESYGGDRWMPLPEPPSAK